MSRLLVAVAVVGGLALVLAAATLVVSGSLFAVMHVLYLHAVLGLPLLGLGALLLRPPAVGTRLVAALLVMAAGVGAYATYVEPRRLVVERADVAVATASARSRPLVIAVLADIQARRVGAHERRAVEQAMSARPDLILIPGDVFQGSPEEFAAEQGAFRELLGRLSAPGGVFLVEGDTDTVPGLRELTTGTQVQLLVEEMAETTVAGQRVLIAGTSLSVASPGSQSAIQQLRSDPDPAAVRIVLAHRPDAVLTLAADDDIDLTVAGHTHGGQVRIPGLGPLLTLSSVPNAVAAGGLHAVAGNPVYVSRGIGLERREAPPLRLFCPPEVSILTLR